MEILLAIVVASAVIFFGALISMGNERQRKAIDGLREQVVLWAVQDLNIKSENLAQNIRVDNPEDWLNRVASKVIGYDLDLKIVESSSVFASLLCTSSEGSVKVIFTPYSPSEIRNFKKNGYNRLNTITNNLLLSIPKKAVAYEASTFNDGITFNLELDLVWERLTGKRIGVMNRLWLYHY